MIKDSKLTVLDCTLRDGGYYNSWEFSNDLINEYLVAMQSANIDVVEIGFRFIKNQGFKGACAFSTDTFLENLNIPRDLKISVMINAADLFYETNTKKSLNKLFPNSHVNSKVDIVRIASHFDELNVSIEASNWLSEKGFDVGINLMQISDRSEKQIEEFAKLANDKSIKVVYFADSLGSLRPVDIKKIVKVLSENCIKPIGVHAHDNMSLALLNTLEALNYGATWLDSTVMGMGRGPGNVKTENLLFEIENLREKPLNILPLMTFSSKYLKPLQKKYQWGTNLYYYLAGKFGIHPTYIQEMLVDPRFNEEDIISVIKNLKLSGGKKFSFNNLHGARNFYKNKKNGNWVPAKEISEKKVLILAPGPSLKKYKKEIEDYIIKNNLIVIALNSDQIINPDLINYRAACHPLRLLADMPTYKLLKQPLITPYSMLPEVIKKELNKDNILDFGIQIDPPLFSVDKNSCKIPNLLVLGYALGVVKSGKVSKIFLAGFDGYPTGDVRNNEVEDVINSFLIAFKEMNLISITPTSYKGLRSQSLYAN